jgi:hypothetical protein
VLDLAEVTFIDCAGISTLLAARRQALLAGGSLRVLRASPRVRRIISLTRLDPLLMPTALSEAAASCGRAGEISRQPGTLPTRTDCDTMRAASWARDVTLTLR